MVPASTHSHHWQLRTNPPPFGLIYLYFSYSVSHPTIIVTNVAMTMDINRYRGDSPLSQYDSVAFAATLTSLVALGVENRATRWRPNRVQSARNFQASPRLFRNSFQIDVIAFKPTVRHWTVADMSPLCRRLYVCPSVVSLSQASSSVCHVCIVFKRTNESKTVCWSQ